MPVLGKFFSAPKDTAEDIKKIDVSVGKVFDSARNFINREDLALGCSSMLEKANSLADKEREGQLVRAYFCFEEFITENKPLVVKQEINKIDLRKEISKKAPIDELPLKLKIPFLDKRNQLLSVFGLATNSLVKYLKSNIGETNFNTFLRASVAGSVLSGRVSLVGDYLVFEQISGSSDLLINDKELEYSLKNLFDSLAKEVSAGFGRSMSEALVKSSLDSFSSVLPLEFIRIFLDIAPLDFLTEEKASILERGELQKKFTEVVKEERTRSHEAEELSRQLQQTVSELNANKAAVLNLLEDIGAEKNKIEKEVQLRTEELKNERSVLRSTIDSLPVACFLISSELVLLENNSLLARVFSADKIDSFYDMENRFNGFFSIRERCLAVLENLKPQVFPNISYGNKFFKIYLQPVVSVDTGSKIGLLGIIEDITEQKILDRAKDEFFSIASHELRTPLTAIMGNTSMIMEFFEAQLPNNEVKQMVEDIHEASTRLLKIVGDFLDVSRLEQGKIIFKSTKFDLGEVVKELARDFDSAATLKGLKLEVGEISDGVSVYADESKVRQIMSNLINNAISYTQKGGVSLYLKKDEPGFVSCYIKDTGVGISKENQMLLFRKFQQAQEKILTRDASRSTGLGLYISKLLATAMGGRVELVESELGKGSTFRVVLPIKV
ncbi:MAG TPA: HAMP domain-containing sensor histidine kinase [Candidatus Paceibacterota bacterium]|nr:HAMP domain-containing sensor histidine kinase [Candidatus Paceibacterota bacterium]